MSKPKKSDAARLRRAAQRAEHKAEKKAIKADRKEARKKGLMINNQLLAAGTKLRRTREIITELEAKVVARSRAVVAESMAKGSQYVDVIKPKDRTDFITLLSLYERAKGLEAEIALYLRQEQDTVGLAEFLPTLTREELKIITSTASNVPTESTGSNMTKPKEDSFLDEMKEAMGEDKKPAATSSSYPNQSQVDYLKAVYGLSDDELDLIDATSHHADWKTQPSAYSKGDNNVGKGYNYSSDAGKIILVTENGAVDGPYSVTHAYRDWWDEGKKVYPTEDKLMTIPFEACEFTYGSVKFNPCVFTATDDYLGARWGRKLDSSDKTWLAEHQLATDDGIPAEYMPVCIHAMMEPYGMGVSRVRVRRGALTAGEAMGQFMQALGVNPFAMVDRQTTNAEAAIKLGMTEAEADRLFKFEFHDDPIPGCTVVGEKGWSSGTGIQTGNMGGHSRYLAPRAAPGNWYVSIALAPLEQIDYNTPVEVPEYKPRKGQATLTLSKIKRPDGQPVGVMVKGTFYSPEEAAEREKPSTKTDLEVPSSGGFRTEAKGSAGGQSPASGDVKGKKAKTSTAVVKSKAKEEEDPRQLNFPKNFHEAVTICAVCEKEKTWAEMSYGCEVCESCSEAAWEKYHCPKCDVKFLKYMVPQFVRRMPASEAGAGKALFQCQNTKCQTILMVKDDNKDFPDLVLFAQAMPEDFTAREFDEGLSEYLESQTGPLTAYFETVEEDELTIEEEYYEKALSVLRDEIEDLKEDIRACTDEFEKAKLVDKILDKIDELNNFENQGWTEEDFDLSLVGGGEFPPEVNAAALARRVPGQADGHVQPDFPEIVDEFSGLQQYD